MAQVDEHRPEPGQLDRPPFRTGRPFGPAGLAFFCDVHRGGRIESIGWTVDSFAG